MSILFTIFMFWLLLKGTGLFLRIFGRIIGIGFGLLGYLFTGIILVTVFGAAFFFIPIIFVIGLVTVIMLVAGSAGA